MQIQQGKVWFLDLVHDALTSLYDPIVLRKSPLIELLGLEQRRNIVLSLRQSLSNAIESLQPNAHTPRDSKVWRSYQILRRRYIEQVMQREVALDLGLSTRQLQRAEAQARETLADYLWDAFDLDAKIQHLELPEPPLFSRGSYEDTPSREQELEYLRQSAQDHATDVDTLIREALRTLQPLFSVRGAEVEYSGPETGAILYLQAPILRQALINLLSAALQCVTEWQVQVRVIVSARLIPGQLLLNIRGYLDQDVELDCAASADSLEMTQHLIELCGGNMDARIDSVREAAYAASVSLPVKTPVTVLVIDDNADTRQLFQRYLHGTRYRAVGLPDCQEGMAFAVEERPSLIVLDVMMPGQDGWATLGQLRQHPETAEIPVIVCTILAQESLAFALGAAGFLRKPVSREGLLAALDHQLALAGQATC
jgi:CheY-like chemotaxis protein